MEQIDTRSTIENLGLNQSMDSNNSGKAKTIFNKRKEPERIDGLESLVPLIIKLQNVFNQIKAKNTIELP